jgi:hypothetical protein
MPVHDALLVHIKKKGWARKILELVKVMEDASEKVIGFRIPVDIKVIRKHFFQADSDGEKWNRLHEKYLQAKKKVYDFSTPIVDQGCTNKVTPCHQNTTPAQSTVYLNRLHQRRGTGA